MVYGNGTRVRYVYDSLQRLTALRSYTADDELMQDIAYHYDSVGNILDIENSASTLGNGLGGAYRQEYTYDGLYRLTRATGWWKCRPDHLTLRDTVDMRYSKNGRIIRKRMSAETLKNMQLNLVRCDRQYQYPSVYSNKVNSVTDAMSGTSHQFEWESGGNLMRHANPDQHYDRRLWWTEDNRLQFVKDNGSTGAYYQYDAGGDRTYKLLYHKTTGSLNGVQTDYYTLDDATLYVSPYLVVTPQGYTKHYYAESERITTQLGKYRFAVVDSCVAGDSLASVKLQNAVQAFPTDSFPTPAPMLGYLHSLVSKPKAVSTLYFYHPDHLGSASWITNIYGRTIQHLYYLPWGEDFVNQRTGSFSSMYTFSAKEKDTETGYSYFGARYYSSDLSIWLSVDPMSDNYPSLSPYTYCADNSIKLVDPNGEAIIVPLIIKGTNNSSITFETNIINSTFDVSKLGIDFGGNFTLQGDEVLSAALDLAGIVDPTGAADAANAVLHATNKNWKEAGICAVGLIPYLGDLAKLGKIKKDIRIIQKTINQLKLPPKGLGNPFKDKTLKEIDDGFQRYIQEGKLKPATGSAPGHKAYVNTKSGYSYNLDPGNTKEGPHVDVKYPHGINKPKKKLPAAGGF